MDIEKKLSILGAAAKYDVCASSSCNASTGVRYSEEPRVGNLQRSGICHSFLPDGRCISLFKVLLSNVCEKNCLYCPSRRDNDVPRATFGKDECAKLFIDLYRANYVEGLFLSTAVFSGPDRSMAEMLDVCHILRTVYSFRGYIHLKILPGVSDSMVEEAMKTATRVSINLEAPNAAYLSMIAPEKDFARDIVTKLDAVRATILRGIVPNAGYTTQFIVGAAGEGDRDILKTTAYLYRRYRLRRAYFSAFIPVQRTPLEQRAPVSLTREHTLYQADWLMRRYGFEFEELPFDENGNLPEGDPKIAWAERNARLFPIEVNRATKRELMRVPGIGERSARRIVVARQTAKIKDGQTLSRMGVVVKRALAYLLLDGKKERVLRAGDDNGQLSLFT